MPGPQNARSVPIVDSSWSRRSPSFGNGRSYAACSRSYQPAPSPQNARPPDTASRVATIFASSGADRNVTGVTRAPSWTPLGHAGEISQRRVGLGNRIPRTTHLRDLEEMIHDGDGGESRLLGRSGDGASQSRRSTSEGNREICRANRKPTRRRQLGESGGGCAREVGGFGRRALIGGDDEIESVGDEIEVRRRGCNWAASAGAGTGRSRARLRARQVAASVVNRTATAGSPADLASSTAARRRRSSRPSVSTTAVMPRFTRAATIASRTAKASSRGIQVALTAADHRPQCIGGNDLVGREAFPRPRRLSRAGRADEHDQRGVGMTPLSTVRGARSLDDAGGSPQAVLGARCPQARVPAPRRRGARVACTHDLDAGVPDVC